MKKRILLTVLSLSLISLTISSCRNQDSNNTQSVTVQGDERLAISNQPNKTSFYIYDKLDLSGLKITQDSYTDNKISSSKEITDYTIVDENGKTIKDGDIITKEHENGLTLTFKKEGCKSVSISFIIYESTKFNQYLEITSLGKQSFIQNSTFTYDSLEVALITSYKGEKKITRTDVLASTDYTLTLTKGSKTYSTSNLTLTDLGIYTVTISTQGYEKTLSTSYTISVITQEAYNQLINLTRDKDTTINYTTDTTKMTVSFTNSTKTLDEDDKGYYSPDEVTNFYNVNDYSKNNYFGWKFTPSTGDVPLLVIPVITPGDESKATSENLNLINQAFFGDSSDLNFESLRSYYTQSSYNQLNFVGGVTDYFTPSTVDSKYGDISYYNTTTIQSIPQMALEWAVENYSIDLTKYDSNNDGYIDGIWLIYTHDINYNDTSTFWAYTSTTSATNGTIEKPVANTYAWASIDFINGTFSKKYNNDTANGTCDAHVIIHETGHMLGLSDYYSYNTRSGYDPLANTDMMNKNLMDHNGYSKLFLNWVTPYIVYGNATITLDSCQSKNAVIVIPYDNRTYEKDSNGKIKFNVFDEYLVLDYYTYKNLNTQDYLTYQAYSVKYNGGRLYHVDGRLCQVGRDNNIDLVEDVDKVFNTTNSTYRIISNTESGSQCEDSMGLAGCSDFDEIRLITANNIKVNGTTKLTQNSWFNVNDTFDIASYSNEFNTTTSGSKTYYFNNKKSFSTSFTIKSIN